MSCLRESLHSIPIPLTVQSVWYNAGTTTWGTGSKQHGKNFVVCHISQEILQCEWSSARYWFRSWALDFVNEFHGRLPQVQLLIVLYVSGCTDPGFMRRYPSNNYRSIPNSWNSKLGHQIIENHTKECFKAAWIRCRTFVNADAKLTKSDPSKGKPKLEYSRGSVIVSLPLKIYLLDLLQLCYSNPHWLLHDRLIFLVCMRSILTAISE